MMLPKLLGAATALSLAAFVSATDIPTTSVCATPESWADPLLGSMCLALYVDGYTSSQIDEHSDQFAKEVRRGGAAFAAASAASRGQSSITTRSMASPRTTPVHRLIKK
jgi:hypothetical protein